MDKTGTLTIGAPVVLGMVTAEGITGDDLLATASALGRRSLHPLDTAIVALAAVKNLPGTFYRPSGDHPRSWYDRSGSTVRRS